jgi:hypothetical protein
VLRKSEKWNRLKLSIETDKNSIGQFMPINKEMHEAEIPQNKE